MIETIFVGQSALIIIIIVIIIIIIIIIIEFIQRLYITVLSAKNKLVRKNAVTYA